MPKPSRSTALSRRDFLERSLGATTSALIPISGAAATPTPIHRTPAKGPLRVFSQNPRYFTDGSGQAVYLTGSHTWPSLVDMGASNPPPPFDFKGYLDFLERHHHNFIRLWTWESTTWDTAGNGERLRHHVSPLAWARPGPGLALDGQPRFDLTKFDPEYFRRLRTRVQAANARGIYTSVMLFEGWAMQHAPGAWESHPFHPANHINDLPNHLDDDHRGLEIHTLQFPHITRLQEIYVRQVIDSINDLDNVLYEISNENHPPSTPWQFHLIRFIREIERSLPKQHPIGMTFQYKGGSNQTLFDSPADWISPNPDGGYRDDPPAADGRKVILNDTDHLWGIGGNPAWAWKSFFRGMHPLFMDPYDNAVLNQGKPDSWEPLRQTLGLTRRLADRLPLAGMVPRPDLASTNYCLAGRQEEHLTLVAFAPANTPSIDLDLSEFDGPLQVRWHPATSLATQITDSILAGTDVTVHNPFPEDAILQLNTPTPAGSPAPE